MSPVVLAKKSDGTMRFCIDYRKLNENTVRKQYQICHMDDLLCEINNGTILGKLDLESAYLQIALKESDKYKSGFITNQGCFEWNVMPFGLINAPFTFQRIINTVIKDAIGKFVVTYLDDILIYSRNKDEHLKHLEWVFKQLDLYGLKLNIKKCEFLKDKVRFLGFEVSAGRICIPDESKKEAVDFKLPENQRDLRSFLGFITFFKRFIPNFSAKADCLYGLLKKDTLLSFGDKHLRAFDTIKRDIQQSKSLWLPDLSKEFTIYTDASNIGLGAVLTQIQNGQVVPVLWSSKRLLPREKNYTLTEKESLGVIWALDQYKPYLHKKFVICNDHQALKWLLGQKEPKERLARWIMKLSAYDYEFKFISGKDNTFADLLSSGTIHLKTISAVEQEIPDELSDAEKQELILRAHIATAHGSREPVFLYLRNYSRWKGMRADITEFISRCSVCNLYNKNDQKLETTRTTLEDPFFKIGIDVIEPLPKDELGFRYIVAATDYTSRWAEVMPLKNKSKENIA
ncbi:LTR retrotransposon, partial [Pseudoloma neurophilia]